jgi:hypothetical protein
MGKDWRRWGWNGLDSVHDGCNKYTLRDASTNGTFREHCCIGINRASE